MQAPPGLDALERRLRSTLSLVVAAMLGASAVLCPGDGVAAEPSDQARITVAPAIVAKAASEAELVIEVGPAHAVLPRSFVSLRGLPPRVSLTEGHLISPGLWALPLSTLPSLRARIPADISGRSEIVIRLIGMDGRLLAQATTALIVEPAGSLPPQQSTAPGKPAQAAAPAAPQLPPSREERGREAAPHPPELAAGEKARAEHLLARGLDYLAVGNFAAARDFFERAADMGLAAAALRLAATYDPLELARIQVQGVVPDRALARKWYERAKELGAPEAASQLAKLEGGN
jgi:hypothetical protein